MPTDEERWLAAIATFPPALRARLEQAAAARGVSAVTLAQRLCAEGLERLRAARTRTRPTRGPSAGRSGRSRRQ
jgi:hypothetical protein